MFPFLAFVTTSLAVADAPESSDSNPLNGDYRIANRAQAKRAISDGIDRAVSKMFFAKRPIAKKLLKSANPILEQLHFEFNGDEMHYLYNGDKPIDGTVGKPFRPWKSPEDNKTYQIKEEFRGTSMVQTIEGKDGTKVETFSLSNDGATLTYSVEVTSPQLPEPLRYSYDFKRK